MDFEHMTVTKRRDQRMSIVLPLRVSAQSGLQGNRVELAHTLDVSSRGARLGAIRHELEIGSRLVIQYHQRRIESRVVWTRLLEGTSEYQVGVELLAKDVDTWGLDLKDVKTAEEIEAELVTA
jgi:hypothetical protein